MRYSRLLSAIARTFVANPNQQLMRSTEALTFQAHVGVDTCGPTGVRLGSGPASALPRKTRTGGTKLLTRSKEGQTNELEPTGLFTEPTGLFTDASPEFAVVALAGGRLAGISAGAWLRFGGRDRRESGRTASVGVYAARWCPADLIFLRGGFDPQFGFVRFIMIIEKREGVPHRPQACMTPHRFAASGMGRT